MSDERGKWSRRKKLGRLVGERGAHMDGWRPKGSSCPGHIPWPGL